MPPILLVGCPVYDREWIMPSWFEHVETACAQVGIVPQYVFVGDARDTDTWSVIQDTTRELDRQCFASWAEESGQKYVRAWNTQRYERMAYLRNTMLGAVREIAPQLFLSLDSDVLITPNALEGAIDLLMRFGYDACGMKCYMTPTGTGAPSYGYLSPDERFLSRPDTDQILLVDVIMAAKLMNPLAYCVDYTSHGLGEDIGWSKSARALSLKLAWDGRWVSRHIMLPEMLHELDRRCPDA